ncbi:hypothetical protein SLNSH_04270 [Alsobacter soli]|uniref:Permease n=1 Tax=Alsobacter soli TaxID=2109933 RepID=A0A2T1HYC5_9HYPH|nr:LptF/LptG family permease [Alsobacter soli]PSC06499.1 hypothetical protein SLNSH_04270 [Alsobacter soli]
MRAPAPTPRAWGRLRRFALGVHTRAMLCHHLWFISLTLFAIVGSVTAINVSSEIAQVWAEGAALGAAPSRTAAYIAYRLLDNGSQAFPIAFLLGLIWAEAAHAASGRLAMVRTVGMSFAGRSAALFILAAASVPAQFLLDNVVRPYAFMSLSRSHLGEYGWAYAAARKPHASWLAVGGRVIQATLQDAPDPKLGPATVYDFDAQGDLLRVAEAGVFAVSPAEPFLLRARGASVWTMQPDRGEAASAAGAEAPVGARVHQEDITIALSPRWLLYRGIHPKYVPLPDLIALSRDRALPNNPPQYAEWLRIRLSQALTPGLAAIAVAGLFAVAYDLWGLAAAAMAGLAASYLAYLGARIAAIAIESHLGPAIVAAAALPLALAAADGWLLYRLSPREHHR